MHTSKGITATAQQVHHIKPLATEEGFEMRLHWNNLMSVCTACHARIESDARRDER